MIRKAIDKILGGIVLALVYLAFIVAGQINEDPMGECQWPRRDD